MWEISFVTGEELLKLVDLACGLWNLDATKQRKTEMREAWKLMLHDLDFAACRKALTDLAVIETFMPRAGQIRRTVLAPKEPFPTPLEAWLQFQSLLKSVTSGTYNTEPVHSAVQETVKRLNGGYGLYTNGDREAFIDVYKKVISEIESRLYAVEDK